MAPLAGRNFGRKGLNFGRMKLLAPPQKWPRYAYGPIYIMWIVLWPFFWLPNNISSLLFDHAMPWFHVHGFMIVSQVTGLLEWPCTQMCKWSPDCRDALFPDPELPQLVLSTQHHGPSPEYANKHEDDGNNIETLLIIFSSHPIFFANIFILISQSIKKH